MSSTAPSSNARLSPGVSVVIPAYNHEQYVDATLESLAALRPPLTEVIVVDDCSRDGTLEAAKASAAKHSLPARFLRHEVNRGICATLNDGLREVQTEYVMFLASDDTVPPDKLERQLDFLVAHPEFVAVYADMMIMSPEGTPLRVDRSFDRTTNVQPTGASLEMSFERVALGKSSAFIQSGLFKTEELRKLGGFDEHLKFEDLDITLRLLRTGRIAYLCDVGARYRSNPAGTNRNFRALESDYETILRKHEDHAHSIGIAWKQIEAANALRKANNRANVDDRIDALRWAVAALRHQPTLWSAYAVIARVTAPHRARHALRELRRRLRGSNARSN